MEKNKITSGLTCFSALCAFTFAGNWREFANAKSTDELIAAVRSPAITELEFQARAISFGAVPIATHLADRNLQPPETRQALHARLVSAQLEWIELQSLKDQGAGPESGIRSGTAIDALLALEYEDDWNDEAQNIFLEFLIRKATLLQQKNSKPEGQYYSLLHRIAQHIKQRQSANATSEAQQTAVFFEAKKLAETLTPTSQTFENLPSDVQGVLVNGVWYPRSQDLFVIYFPQSNKAVAIEKSKVRLTFVSNLYQPKTLILERPQDFYDLGFRRSWVRSDSPCSVDHAKFLSTDAAPVVLGEGACEAAIGMVGTHLSNTGLKQIVDFGHGSVPRDPFQSVPPLPPPPSVRPWVWAALGSVAVLAIVISARTKEPHVQPTTSSGW